MPQTIYMKIVAAKALGLGGLMVRCCLGVVSGLLLVTAGAIGCLEWQPRPKPRGAS